MIKLHLEFSKTTDGLIEQLESCGKLCGIDHYTIMKFSTNFRVCLGTPESHDDIQSMAVGKTLDEAIRQCICDHFGIPLCSSIKPYSGNDC